MSDLEPVTLYCCKVCQHLHHAIVTACDCGTGCEPFEYEIWEARRTQPEATAPATIPKVEIELPAGDPRKVKIHLDTITDGVRWLCCTIESPAAQDLSAAILSIKLPEPFFAGGEDAGFYFPPSFSEDQMRNLLKAAAALASSANALSAGDRVDAQKVARYDYLVSKGFDIEFISGEDGHTTIATSYCYSGPKEKFAEWVGAQIDAAIQERKNANQT